LCRDRRALTSGGVRPGAFPFLRGRFSAILATLFGNAGTSTGRRESMDGKTKALSAARDAPRSAAARRSASDISRFGHHASAASCRASSTSTKRFSGETPLRIRRHSSPTRQRGMWGKYRDKHIPRGRLHKEVGSKNKFQRGPTFLPRKGAKTAKGFLLRPLRSFVARLPAPCLGSS
jgi:hypothetical protein